MNQQYYPIILQVGARFLRAGFAGDAVPIVQRRTNSYDLSGAQLTPLNYTHSNELEREGIEHEQQQFLWTNDLVLLDQDRLEAMLERIIYDLYKNDLLVDPKKCKVLIVEHPFCPVPLKKVLAHVLLFHMHSQSVRFLPESVMSAVSSGSHCGLVIDLGWNQTTLTPVFDFRQLYKHVKQTRRAGRLLHDEVRKSLKKLGLEPTFEFIERFICEAMYCGIENTKQGEFTFDGIAVPQDLRFRSLEDILFAKHEDQDDDMRPISVLVEEIIHEVNIDLRSPLSSRIIFTGGLSRIPGVKSRMLYEINKDIKASAIASLGAWEGTSLYCSTSLMSSATTKRKSSELQRDKYIADDAILLDWTDELYGQAT
jgi:actin-related protein